MKDEKDGVSIPDAEVRAFCESILKSELFAHAPRMSCLLRFLVEKAIAGDIRNTNEYAIGIEVFGRKPSVYNTNEDPIVRVQVGRLRRKLENYFATPGLGTNIEILIPVGIYMPLIRRTRVENYATPYTPLVAIHPFKCISLGGHGETFTQGLHDELIHQLFKEFGTTIVAYPNIMLGFEDQNRRARKNFSATDVNHLLEGSIQIDAEQIRASIRLIEATQCSIAWSAQFNRNLSLAISHQEELACSICEGLKHFFRGRNVLLPSSLGDKREQRLVYIANQQS